MMMPVLKPFKLPIITKRQEVLELIRGELSATSIELIQLTDGKQLREFNGDTEPACVLIEVTENTSDELQMINELHVKHPDLQIIALSENWTVQTAVHAIKRGAAEICELPSEGGVIQNAIQHALQSCRHNARRLQDLIPQAILEKLSTVEARILTLLIQGRTTKEVGATLDVSIRTIHYRKKTLLRKLGVESRSEAIEMIRVANGSLTFF